MSELKEYTVLRPIAYGGRIEAGYTVKFDDETAATFAPGFLQLKEPVAEAVAAPVSAEAKTDGVDGDSQTVPPVTEPVPPVEPAPTEPVTPPADPVPPVTEPEQPVV